MPSLEQNLLDTYRIKFSEKNPENRATALEAAKDNDKNKVLKTIEDSLNAPSVIYSAILGAVISKNEELIKFLIFKYGKNQRRNKLWGNFPLFDLVNSTYKDEEKKLCEPISQGIYLFCVSYFSKEHCQDIIPNLIEQFRDFLPEIIEGAKANQCFDTLAFCYKTNSTLNSQVEDSATKYEMNFVNELVKYGANINKAMKGFKRNSAVASIELASEIDNKKLRELFIIEKLHGGEKDNACEKNFKKAAHINRIMRFHTTDFKTAEAHYNAHSQNGMPAFTRLLQFLETDLDKDCVSILYRTLVKYPDIDNLDLIKITPKLIEIDKKEHENQKIISTFKEKYIRDYQSSFFNKSSGMLKMLNSGKIIHPSQIEDYIKEHPESRTAKLYK